MIDYSYSLFRAFYHGMIAPYSAIFSFAGIFGALIIGVALVSGALVRLFAALGFVMLIALAMAVNIGILHPHVTSTMALICLVLCLAGAGRAYGIDHYLRERVPRWLT